MNNTTAKCPAMVRAGIYNPESNEGKVFCTEYCPYEGGCILFDHPRGQQGRKIIEKVKFVKNLRNHGVSEEDITLILGCSKRTVQGYLKR